jgi:MoaA/NifB/PqqE/SkfB family radical SAM enzyme
VARELNTEEWITILDKAWQAGIPHVVFTGGEATLRDDLPELVAHTQKIGQVCGLISNGLRLADEIYLGKLLQAGLDHLMIVLQPDNEQSWQAVANSLVEDLFVAVHLTITAENQAQTSLHLERLASLSVRHISLSADDVASGPALQAAREKAAALHMALVWNLPVPYAANNPIALESAQLPGGAPQEGAGRAWCYVEPDGDVRPTQGDARVMGNILTDPWEEIWHG